MSRDLTRREFLRSTAAVGVGAAAVSVGFSSCTTTDTGLDFYRPAIDLAVARGASPAKNCLAAVEALGGFGKFVHEGDKVVVKPNPIGSHRPEMAVNTHPDMVEAVIRECFAVGAAEVIALSHDSPRSFADNGTAEAVERAGGVLKVLQEREEFREIPVPRGRIIRRVEIARDLLDADVFINMPIAKHHGASRVTFAMKNLMGVNWDRITFHRTDLHLCIAELATAVRHNLIILDANNVLLTNGPGGPGRVVQPKEVIAGVDPVAIDAIATKYFDSPPATVPHIRQAFELGVGEMNLDRLRIKEFDA